MNKEEIQSRELSAIREGLSMTLTIAEMEVVDNLIDMIEKQNDMIYVLQDMLETYKSEYRAIKG